MNAMLRRLEDVARRFAELRAEQASPEVMGDRKRLLDVTKRLAEIEPVVAAYHNYRHLRDEEQTTHEMLDGECDPELRAMAEEEVASLGARLVEQAAAIKVLLLPADPNDHRNVIL